MRRKIGYCACLAVLASCATSRAGFINETHVQTTKVTEMLPGIPNPGLNPATDTVNFSITNKSGVTWADYEVLFIGPAGGFDATSVITTANLKLGAGLDSGTIKNTAGAFPVSPTSLVHVVGKIANNATITFSVDLSYNFSVDVNGTPSFAVPEPSSLLMTGMAIACASMFTAARELKRRPSRVR